MHDVVYANRDRRFYATILCKTEPSTFEHCHHTPRGNNIHYLSNVQQDRHMTKIGLHIPQRHVRRYLGSTGMYSTDYAYSILRLGRSYLNYAEALLRQKKAAGVAEAIEYINKTRTTHGELPALPTKLKFGGNLEVLQD